MEAPELRELLGSAAPTPTATLDIGAIERRVDRRRRRRHGVFAASSLLIVVVLVGLTALLFDTAGSRTVIAGPPSTQTIPLHIDAGTAILEIGLLDGTRLRVTLPASVGAAFSGATFSDVVH